ncbi:MAG: M48 family metalloprotease [Candidatus Saganbacteria bacterium]|nr:M48 family metalloprotease [Candidatus Saganbacteria bacterium]
MRKFKFLLLISSLFLISSLTGCATAPTDEELKKIGDTVAENMVDQYGEYRDATLEGYVEGVGQKVEAATPLPGPLNFYVLDTELVNAFSVPGGHIFVTRGLLARANSEAELAMVLGHEMGHLAAKHQAQRISQIRTSTFFSNLTYLVVGLWTKSETAASFAEAITDFSSVLVILNYGREAEFEADKLGIEFTEKSGYDPQAGEKFLETLESMEKDDRSFIEDLLATHPPSDERVSKAKVVSAKLKKPGEPLYVGDNDFKLKIKGMIIGPSLERGFIKDKVYYNRNYMFTLKSYEDWYLGTSGKYKAGLVKPGNLFLVYPEKPMNKQPLSEWSKNFIKDALGDEKINPILKERTLKGLPAYYDKFDIEGKQLRVLTFTKDDIYYALIYTYLPQVFANYDDIFEKLIDRFDFMSAEAAQGISEDKLEIYRAVGGDTWEGLSQGLYNDPKLAKKLQLFNGSVAIKENEVIKIPPIKYLKKI